MQCSGVSLVYDLNPHHLLGGGGGGGDSSSSSSSSSSSREEHNSPAYYMGIPGMTFLSFPLDGMKPGPPGGRWETGNMWSKRKGRYWDIGMR